MNRSFRSKALFIVIILWFAITNHQAGAVESSPSSYADSLKAFEKFVSEQMEIQRIPGLSIGFIKDEFIWTKGFGYADLENKVLAKPESSYRLASVTKTITAIAVLQLVERGKIDLEAEVQTYVPYFPKKKWPVTVRQLLGHVGGISHYKNYDVEGHIKVHKNTQEALAIFQDFDLVAEPGTRYNYSSYGYNLLGAVIEAASGQSYGDYLKEHIFGPLGMKDSRMDDPVELIPHRVRGYRIIEGEIKNSEFVDISSRFAGGGTRSTVVDLLKYAQGIFSGPLLKEETWRQMFTSMVLKDQHLTGYGMGWNVRPVRGHYTVRHSGSQPETRTSLLLFPKEKFAVAIGCNRERADLVPFMRGLIQLLMDEDIRSSAYTPSRTEQAIYDACAEAFFYGFSFYDKHETHLSKNSQELKEAFSYFHKHVNEAALMNNFKAAKKKLDDGIHPLSNQAFVKIGSYMASALDRNLGKERLEEYHHAGTLSFFKDYIVLSEKRPELKNFQFEKNFCELISLWEKDWRTTQTDYVRSLFLTANTDFDEVGPKLKEIFSGAEIYKDFSSDMDRIAQKLLEQNRNDETLRMLHLSQELYPNSPAPYSSLAFAKIWIGNAAEARHLFHKARAINPSHPAVEINQFYRYARQLEQAKKIKEATLLGEIATELFPKEARLYADFADLFLQTGQKDKAIKYLKKALEINPEHEAAKTKLEKLRKDKEKEK
ncbi:MAG: serine hydrolase [Candidatus Aminicenantes bacterium]|nr:serine hydrolase [Candidatus Aminicenantes bacterium]